MILPFISVLLILSILGDTLAYCPLIKNPSTKHHRHNYKHISFHASKDLTSIETTETLFPVLQRIKGIDWVGNCRYVSGSDLTPANFLLRGGTRYDIKNDTTNGKTRQVTMKGKRSNPNRTSIRLDPASDDGPIYMVLTELPPDTILMHEVDKVSGRIVMTSSLSLVGKKRVDEIITISHELGADVSVDGHQVWRFGRACGDDSAVERGFRDATGV